MVGAAGQKSLWAGTRGNNEDGNARVLKGRVILDDWFQETTGRDGASLFFLNKNGKPVPPPQQIR